VGKAFAHGMRPVILSFVLILILAACGGSSSNSTSSVTLNLGYFANLTHSVALVGLGNGTFKKDLPSTVTISTKTFNVGSTEAAALLGGSIDIAFFGPGPAVNAYTQSHNTALKVISGASSAGVQFIVQPDENMSTAANLSGKRLADPGKGGTQDVALRYYLKQHGLKPSDKGGDVQITSTDNATILSLFKQHQIDGAWMPEPWATRLQVEGKGKVFLNEKDLWPGGQFTTTLVAVRQAFLTAHPDIVKKFVEGVVDTVQYIKANPAQAAQIANDQIKALTGSSTRSDELMQAFNDLTITYDPLASTITQEAQRTFDLGLVKTKPDLSQFYDLGPLNDILSTKGLPKVTTS
jgi:NitT/TauT family transport system substrate-binding protein